MNFIRGIVFNFFYGLSMVLFCVPGLPLGPFIPYPKRLAFLNIWPRIVQFLLATICNIRFKVEGAENIPEGPYVLVSNHQSSWETLALSFLFQPVSPVLKKELTYIPFFGWLLYLTKPIIIDRSRKTSALKDILRQGQEHLAQGVSVVIYPEGTRIAVGEETPHMPGGAMLACKANVPILPVVHNAGLFWPAHRIAKKPGVITVKVGAAVLTEGRSPKELNRQLEEWMNTEKKKLSGIV